MCARISECVCVCVSVCAWMCVRACERACVCVWVGRGLNGLIKHLTWHPAEPKTKAKAAKVPNLVDAQVKVVVHFINNVR